MGEFRRGTGGAGEVELAFGEARFRGELDVERFKGDAVPLRLRLSGDVVDGVRFNGVTVDLRAGSSTRVVVGRGTGASLGDAARLLVAPGVGGRGMDLTGAWITGVDERSKGAATGSGAGAIPPPGAATSPTRAATVGWRCLRFGTYSLMETALLGVAAVAGLVGVEAVTAANVPAPGNPTPETPV